MAKKEQSKSMSTTACVATGRTNDGRPKNKSTVSDYQASKQEAPGCRTEKTAASVPSAKPEKKRTPNKDDSDHRLSSEKSYESLETEIAKGSARQMTVGKRKYESSPTETMNVDSCAGTGNTASDTAAVGENGKANKMRKTKAGGKTNVMVQVPLNISADEKTNKKKRKKKSKKKNAAKQSIVEPETSGKSACIGGMSASSAEFYALEYLRKWKRDQGSWTFQKVRQVWLLQHIYDVVRVCEEDFAILLEYMEDLKGHARQATVDEAEKTMRESEDNDANLDGDSPAASADGDVGDKMKTMLSDIQLDRIRQVLQMLS